MKNVKILITVIVCLILSCFSVACNNSSEMDEFTKNAKNIYKVYADYVEEQGGEPLNYEQWLASIRGEKGEKGNGIVNAYFNDKLELILVLDDGEINCGALVLKVEKTANNFVLKVNRAQKIIKEISDRLVEISGEKMYATGSDIVTLILEKFYLIREYFDVKVEIAEIYDGLSESEYYQEISDVMVAYENLEKTFITGFELNAHEFQKENTAKNEVLSQKINILLLLLM